MTSNQNLEKVDENTNENIKMVLLGSSSFFFSPVIFFFLVLEENDKSTNDNFDNPVMYPFFLPILANFHLFHTSYSTPSEFMIRNPEKNDDLNYKKLSTDFVKMNLSAQKSPPEPGFNSLKTKFSFSSTNITNVWGPEPDLTLYNMDYNLKNTYVDESPKPSHFSNVYSNFVGMTVGENKQGAPFYPQNYYPKQSTHHNMSSNNMYSNYGMYPGVFMQNGNAQYQNYHYMNNQKPEYYMNEENFTYGAMRPHFFSQTNIEERKNLGGGTNYKKNTPKKGSLVMRNGNFSTPNNVFGDRGDPEMDFNLDAKNLFDFCKDQLGSRKIQMFFEKASEEEKEILFMKIEGQLLFLIMDVFGNYVVQKMLEKGIIY